MEKSKESALVELVVDMIAWIEELDSLTHKLCRNSSIGISSSRRTKIENVSRKLNNLGRIIKEEQQEVNK